MENVVIFDFDNTLYNGNVWNNWDNYITKFLNEYFKNDVEKENFLKKYVSNASFLDERRICKGFIEEYGSSKPMIDYLIENPYEYNGDNVKFISNEFLELLSKKYSLYIVSNTPSETIKIALKKYNINPNIFKDILFNPQEKLDSSKKEKYQKIMQIEKVKNTNIIVVGDSFSSDIEPAIQLDMHYLQVNSIDDIYNHNFDCDFKSDGI